LLLSLKKRSLTKFQQLEAIATIPRVTLKGQYSMHFKLGPVDLKGNDKSSSIIEDLKVKVKMSGSKYNKNGAEYFKANNVDIQIRLVRITMKFENLFNDDETLNKVANELINQNTDMFIDDVKPAVEKSIAQKVKALINEIFEKAPFDVFVP